MAYALPSSTALAKVTATIVGSPGALFTTSFGPVSTAAARAAVASILDPSHPDPTVFDPSDPLALFIIQAVVIISFSRALAYFLGRLRQPRVISEVIAGIIIGPSAFGRIPGFTAHIFPAPSLPYLNLVATIGLVLFLFLVGLEVDFSLFKRNMIPASSISFFGMIIPFALGAAVSKGIYDRFVDTAQVQFGTFLLFIGTANAITAFPVLARILTELELLQNHVGVIVLSAGVGNDVCGWILLALAIALVNASSGIIVLYVLLTCIAWVLTLFFIIRPLLNYMCRKSGSFSSSGPTQGIICFIICLVLASAWITDRIGVHAIFGGFVVGLIVPREIRESVTEKVEDLVSCLFLPLYFALSGLKTDLGLLSNGAIWGWTVCVILTAFFGKFISCGLAAKVTGMDWRESGAVGSLMACKGLVELIVLNIGLSAGILNSEVFAMFVTMALVTTFVTTPLTLAFYPASYRLDKEKLARGSPATSSDLLPRGEVGARHVTLSKFSIVLERFEHLPAIFTFVKLIKAPLDLGSLTTITSRPTSGSSFDEKSSAAVEPVTTEQTHRDSRLITIDALRLIELSQRPSALIKASESEAMLKASDPLHQIFRSFTIGAGIPTTCGITVLAAESYATAVTNFADDKGSELILLPWSLEATSSGSEMLESGGSYNPFESIFSNGAGASGSATRREGGPQYASFVRKVFAEASCSVALFLDRGLDAATISSTGQTHLFFAFHSGSDDRHCLDFVVQLVCKNPGVSATIVRVVPSDEVRESTSKDGSEGEVDVPALFSQLTVQGGSTATDTVYPAHNKLNSDTADNLALNYWFSTSAAPKSSALEAGLKRITYSTVTTTQPFTTSLTQAETLAKSLAPNTPLIIVTGRGRRDAPSHHNELTLYLKLKLDRVKESIARSSEVRRCLGELGTGYLVSGVGRGLLVVQSQGAGVGGGAKNKAV